ISNTLESVTNLAQLGRLLALRIGPKRRGRFQTKILRPDSATGRKSLREFLQGVLRGVKHLEDDIEPGDAEDLQQCLAPRDERTRLASRDKLSSECREDTKAR